MEAIIMATARSAYPSIVYNGTNMAVYMRSYLTSFSYTDNASDETDSIDIGLQDADMRWIGTSWLPKKGDSLSASIVTRNWRSSGDNRSLNCGKFTLDDFRFSGPPTAGTISAVATPADTSFRETEKTKTWEKVTLKEIATSIAGEAGIVLDWRVEEAEFTLQSVEQDEQTNCEFLCQILKRYGYFVKLYSKKIVVFSRLEFKKKPAARSIGKGDISKWSWQTTMNGSYTGGRLTYTDPSTEKTTTSVYKAPQESTDISTGEGERILEINEKSESEADAERIIRAAVENANHGGTTLTISAMGDTGYIAGTCVNVYGLGKLSGKYYIDQVKHSMGSGYSVSLKLTLVDLSGTDISMSYSSRVQEERIAAARSNAARQARMELYRDMRTRQVK